MMTYLEGFFWQSWKNDDVNKGNLFSSDEASINEHYYSYFWRVLDFFLNIYNAVLFLITAAFTGHFYLCVCEFLIIHVRRVIFTVNSNVISFHLICL